MNISDSIRELVATDLCDNSKVDGVRFVDALLALAWKVGEIRCTHVNDRVLHFESPGQSACDVELERAKAKLRLLCARLGVLCNETAGSDVSLYGGEGVIQRKEADLNFSASPNDVLQSKFYFDSSRRSSNDRVLKRWSVRFTNTPSEQEFSIQAMEEDRKSWLL